MSPQPDRGQTRKTVRESDVRDRSLGVGDPQSSSASVGVHNARWTRVDLKGGGAVGSERTFDVAHDLGEVPTLCELVEWDNPATPATHLTARPVSKSLWSAGSVKMAVFLAAGSFDGCVAVFRVSGA